MFLALLVEAEDVGHPVAVEGTIEEDTIEEAPAVEVMTVEATTAGMIAEATDRLLLVEDTVEGTVAEDEDMLRTRDWGHL